MLESRRKVEEEERVGASRSGEKLFPIKEDPRVPGCSRVCSPRPSPAGSTWHPTGATPAVPEKLERKVDKTQMGARSPLLRHCRPAPPVTPGSQIPFLLPSTQTPCTPVPPAVLHNESCGHHMRFGGDEGGAGLGGRGREVTVAWKYAFFILFAKKKKSCLLPVPCSC